MFSLHLFRGEEDESLAIKPPQQIARKDKSHHRKEEKRKDKRRHRSHSAEGGVFYSWTQHIWLIYFFIWKKNLLPLMIFHFFSRETCSTQRQRKRAGKRAQEASVGRRQSQARLGEAETKGTGQSSFTQREVSISSGKVSSVRLAGIKSGTEIVILLITT